MARHTFATTVKLSNGVPIESVSKMLGHKSLKTTQHYSKIVERKLIEDFQKLKKVFRDDEGYLTLVWYLTRKIDQTTTSSTTRLSRDFYHGFFCGMCSGNCLLFIFWLRQWHY